VLAFGTGEGVLNGTYLDFLAHESGWIVAAFTDVMGQTLRGGDLGWCGVDNL
jgi:hypothetical protein